MSLTVISYSLLDLCIVHDFLASGICSSTMQQVIKLTGFESVKLTEKKETVSSGDGARAS